MPWYDVEVAKKENRHELILNGGKINQELRENGFDSALFELVSLNYLNIHESDLKVLENGIAKLHNLQTLVLHSNKLEQLPSTIGDLTKLKMLDVSGNKLKNIPDEITKLVNLMTFNASNNEIATIPSFETLSKLSVLNLSNNKLTEFPDICYAELSNLSDINLHGNLIEIIPNKLQFLVILKNLDLSSNKIGILPGELADCSKLKDLNLKDNPISDRRLLKLIDQCRTKQIVDYVKQHGIRSTEIGANQGKKKSKKNSQSDSNDIEEKQSKKFKITVKHFTNESLKIIVDENTKGIRPYFAGCVVHNIMLDEANFKKFIQLQTKLHETICDKRNSATIASHDLKKVPVGDLKYTAMLPKELMIKPLNLNTEMSGAELFTKLQSEANALRKEKKRNVYSGIHKYLYLLEGKAKYPCLIDANNIVISFPPITNSDVTKISQETTTLLLEVTSSVSHDICKKVMDLLLKDMAILFDTDIVVQQVKNVDHEGNLKFVYPSRNDLIYEGIRNIDVIRE